MFTAILPVLRDEVRRIWCYRSLAAAVTAVIFGLGALYVMSLPNLYAASGQLYVNKSTPLAAATQGISLVGDGYGNSTVAEKTLLNDRNLEEILRKIDPAAATLSERDMARAVSHLREKIHVSPDQGDGFVEIQLEDQDPVRAASVVQLLLNQFIASSVDRNRGELSKTESFLYEQIADCRVRMADTQARLNELRRRTSGLARPVREPGGPMTFDASVQQAPKPLSPRFVAAQEQVTALEAKLATMRTVYTDEYPDVITTRRQLADAVAQREAEASAPARAAGLVHRQALRRRIAVASAIPPALAAELADAQRDDETQRANCQQLIARRQAAHVTEAVLSSDGPGKYQITRAPVVPTIPVGPKRDLYLALAGLAAVGGGLGAAYFRGLVRGTVVSPRELEAACQLPVVATVSWEPAWATVGRRSQTPPFRRRRWPALRSPLRWLRRRNKHVESRR